MTDTDIVTRLRMTGAPHYQSPVCMEAADEIERLRKEIGRLEELAFCGCGDEFTPEVPGKCWVCASSKA